MAASGAEAEAQQRADDRDLGREAGVGEDVLQPAAEHLGPARQHRVRRVVEVVEGGEPGRRGQRVPRQRARLVHGPERGERRHDLGAAAEGADRQAAADDLAEARQVGGDAEQRLRAAPGDPEPGDHLVEDQAARRRASHSARSPSRNPAAGGTRPMLAATGSTITAATSSSSVGHHVVGRDHRVGHGAGGDAGRAGQAEGRHAAAALGQQGVAVAVVVAGELHDLGPAGEAPGQTRMAVIVASVPLLHQPHLLDRRHPLDDGLGQQHLPLGRCAVGRAVAAAAG